MKEFRYYLLIPLALALASWAATGSLKLPPVPLVTFIISLALVAILAGLPFQESSKDTTTQAPRPRWQRRSTWLTTGIVCCSFLAFFSGVIGYLRAPKATQSINQSSTDPSASSPRPAPANSGPPVNQGKASSSSGTKPVVGDVGVLSDVDLFLGKYVNKGVNRKSRKAHWAFAASDQTRSTVPEFDSAIASALTEAGLANIALLRPSLVGDGKLGELYDLDPILMRRLSEFCDGIIVAIADSHPVRDTGVPDVSTVELSMHVRVIPFTNGSTNKTFSIMERGAGFTAGEAERNARQRVGDSLKQQLSAALR